MKQMCKSTSEKKHFLPFNTAAERHVKLWLINNLSVTENAIRSSPELYKIKEDQNIIMPNLYQVMEPTRFITIVYNDIAPEKKKPPKFLKY